MTHGIAVVLAWAVAVGSAAAGVAVVGSPGIAGATRSSVQSGREVLRPATPLCASTGTVTRLTVHRTSAFASNHFRFSFPRVVVVDRPRAVRSVARALCALPTMPEGAFHCPADFGISYHLRFSGPHERFRVVTMDATGCQTVEGLSRPRWTARTPHFWRVLGTAMRVAHPAWTAFRGTGPRG